MVGCGDEVETHHKLTALIEWIYTIFTFIK